MMKAIILKFPVLDATSKLLLEILQQDLLSINYNNKF